MYKRLTVFVAVLILGSLIYREYSLSQLIGNEYKFSLAYINHQEVSYVSYDPEERQVFILTYPAKLEIKSRSEGVYEVGKLYQLGSYDGQAGEFVRKKMQGFMRAPVMGYLVSEKTLKPALLEAFFKRSETTLSRLDALILLARTNTYIQKLEGVEELIRVGAVEKEGEKYNYSPERFQQYLSVRVFDWKIGGEGVTAAVINQSGEDGLGRDISQFLTNAGVDVVSVKGEEDSSEKTRLVVNLADKESLGLSQALSRWFGWPEAVEEDTTQARARMVIYVGKDALKLF